MMATERHVGKYKLEEGEKKLLSAARTYFGGQAMVSPKRQSLRSL